MSELQNEVLDEPVIDSAEPAAPAAELATDSEGQHEQTDQVDEVAVKQAAIDKKFAEKTFEVKQAQRDLQAERDKRIAAEKVVEDKRAAELANIPPMPDPYDDDAQSKMAAREAAIAANARYQYEQESIQSNNAALQQQAQQRENEEVQKSIVGYQQRATDIGISFDELQAAENAVTGYGLSSELAKHLLSDPDGPVLVKHLAANPQEVFELGSMSPYAVGSHLDKIRAKAANLKPKTSNAPEPADKLQGNGVDPDLGKYPALKGTKYE